MIIKSILLIKQFQKHGTMEIIILALLLEIITQIIMKKLLCLVVNLEDFMQI